MVCSTPFTGAPSLLLISLHLKFVRTNARRQRPTRPRPLRSGGAYFEGAALLSRSPCTAPWDVQRFRFLGQEPTGSARERRVEWLGRDGSEWSSLRNRLGLGKFCILGLGTSPFLFCKLYILHYIFLCLLFGPLADVSQNQIKEDPTGRMDPAAPSSAACGWIGCRRRSWSASARRDIPSCMMM